MQDLESYADWRTLGVHYPEDCSEYVLKLRPFCRRSRSCPTKSNPTSRGSDRQTPGSQATGLHYWVCGTARSGLPCRNRIALGKELPGGVNKLIRRRSRLARQDEAPADASLFDSEGNICLRGFKNRSLSCPSRKIHASICEM